MEEGDPIGDILGDLGEFGGISDEAPIEIEKTEILFIGRKELFDQFNELLDPSPDHQLYSVNTIEKAAELLLQHFFTIILLDDQMEIDLPSFSKLLRQNHALARIILLFSGNDFRQTTELFNEGSFDAIITFPTSPDIIYKTIMQQEAQYAIQHEVMNFVREPPKLSKASFLLLDPSLSFGDIDQPVNFVGVMIVVNSVPKYNILFEETLANDEILFAAFLSSITSLGDELFHSKESLKEINFGGISVIFRFAGIIQMAFLVKNLTRHNYENAEMRIDNILMEIFPRYLDTLTSHGLTNQELTELDAIFNKFDATDTSDAELYEESKKAQNKRDFGTQCILLMASPPDSLSEIVNYLNQNSRLVRSDYEVIPLDDIDEVSENIRKNNVAIVILDESAIKASNQSGLFIMESIEELDPAVQIIYFSEDNNLDSEEIDLLNSGNVDFAHVRDDNKFKIFASVQEALKTSERIKQDKAAGSTNLQSKEGLAIAKAMLKENLDAFESEQKPALQGVVIAQNRITEIVPLFTKFYVVDGEQIDLDAELMAGLVTSLKQISGEMFSGEQSFDGLEVGGNNVFVRFNSDFMFLYFVKNISANTSALIAKELDAVTSIYSEIISESIGILSAQDLEPIFSKIALKTHESLTGLLAERSE